MPPDTFNTGLMVIRPSLETLAQMEANLTLITSYNGGDQGYLNNFFHDWYHSSPEHRLPAYYNVQTKLRDAFPPAWMLLEPNIRALHFSPARPWHDLPWNDVEDDVPLTNWEKNRNLRLHDLHLEWWNHYANSIDIDRWGFLFAELDSPPLPIEGGLRIGLHSQSLRRSDGFVSGSEVTTFKLKRAFERHFQSVGLPPIERFSPDPAHLERLYTTELDLLFIEGYADTLPAMIRTLRQAQPNLIIFFWCLSISSSFVHRLDVDAFFTNSKIMQKRLNRFHPTFYAILAGDPEYCKAGPSPPEHMLVTYLGGFTAAKAAESYTLVLDEAVDYNLHVYGPNWAGSPYEMAWKGVWAGKESEVYSKSSATLGMANTCALYRSSY